VLEYSGDGKFWIPTEMLFPSLFDENPIDTKKIKIKKFNKIKHLLEHLLHKTAMDRRYDDRVTTYNS